MSIQRDHIHLIVEADDKAALSAREAPWLRGAARWTTDAASLLTRAPARSIPSA